MRTISKLLAWFLLFSMALGMMPTMVFPVGAEGTGDAVVINAMDYGADPTGATDSAEAIWNALEAAKELEASGKTVTLEFPEGEYHIYKDKAQTREYHTSNTNSIENPIKTIGVLIEEHENLTLDGNGSLFMMHGNMMALAVVKSENITLKDFAWDFAVPTVSELTVTASGSNYTEFYIPACFPYTISGNTLVWSSELSPYTGAPYWTATGNHNTYAIIAYHPDDQMARNFGMDVSPFTNATGITEVGNNVIRITYSSKNSTQTAHHKPGTVFALCGNAHRETAGAFTWESKNVLAEGVNVHFMHGFGWLIQMSEDVTYRNCNLMPRENSGHMTVSFADGLHASGAAGEIVIENCNFSNTHDDPINFHGTFTRVEQRMDDYTLKLKYIHNQQGGFPQFHVGDQVAFFTRDTLESSDNEKLYTVAEVVSDPGESGNDLRTMVVRFAETLPTFLSNTVSNGTPKYVAENVTYAPAVTIRNSTFKNVPTRGILCTTRNPVLIEGNTFLNMSMATIFLSNDSNDWYESGPIRDMTIRNNTFYIKTIGDTYWDYKSAIYIHPVTYGGGLPSYENPIHKNITIEGNTFHMSDDTVVKAESVENLIIRNNTILRTEPEFTITLSAGSGNLSVGQAVTLTTVTDGTTIIGDNNKNLSDTTSRNWDNVFEFKACKNVIIEGNTYDDGMKNYAVYSNMPESYIKNSDEEIRLVTNASMAADAPVSDLVYVSSDPDVVSVDANGQVTALAAGSANVYAYYVWNGTVTKSNALTFTVAGSGGSEGPAVQINREGTIVLDDDTTSIILTANTSVTWSAEDFLTGNATDVVTVNADGTVTAVKNGIAWIKAGANGSEDKIPVVVSLSSVPGLASGFSIIREDSANYTLNDDSLVITQKGGNDLWTYDNTLNNLFLYNNFDKTDMRAIVKVDNLPVRKNNNWDTASFLLYAGDDDYVSIGKKGHMDGFATVVEQSQNCQEFNENTANNNVTSAYLGFTVQNGTVTMDYKVGDGQWVTAKTNSAAFLGTNYKIGFAAWGTGANNITFSQFRVGKASEVSYDRLLSQDALLMGVVKNTAPIVSNVAYNAASYAVGEKATVTYTFTDADGDTQGSSLYLWTYGDAGNVSTAVTSVPEFTVMAPGGLTCAVYPVDSRGMPGVPEEVTVATASGNANLSLSNLEINGIALPVNGDKTAFEVRIPADLTKVDLSYQALMGNEGTTAVAAGSLATQTRGNSDRFGLDITGQDTITITRSAEGQDSKVYTITLVRIESNATEIRGIEIPQLSFAVTDLSAGSWTNRTTAASATLKILADDSIGGVEVRYNNYREPITMTRTADGYEGTIEFITGLNSYYVTVVARDGITTREYNVNAVYTPDTTAALRDLKLNGTSVAGFASGTYAYEVALDGENTLEVEGVSDQRVRIRVDNAYILEDSGETSLRVSDLGVGTHDVYVVTVAGDGIGRTVYHVSVVIPAVEEVTLAIGQSAVFTDDSGYYVGTDTSGLDTAVATVTITGTVTETVKSLSQPVTALESGKQYLIVNTRAQKPVTNAPAEAAAAAGAGSGLSLSGSVQDFADSAIWTITGSNGTYTIQDADGKYMTVGSNIAGITSGAAQLTVAYNGTSWTIAQNGAYLNHFGGNSSTCAAGWQDASAAGDPGSQWAIYEVQEIPTDGTTEITFTGVGSGQTSLRVGETLYQITVSAPTHTHVYDRQVAEDRYLATPATCEAAATYYKSCSCGETGTETFEHGEALNHAAGDTDNDHLCDACGDELSQCADDDKDHNCDVCGDELSQCGDTDNDHNCDVCGDELSQCGDTDNDHNCDVCGDELSQCADDDNDHNCDICGDELSQCGDTDNDHLCDACGDKLSECADPNKDHNCDVCGDKLSDCGDKNKDGKCDICGVSLLDPAPEKPYKIANVVSGVHVYWKATQGAVKYGLWRSETGKNGTYKWVANPTVPHFTDTKVESGKTYYYKVTTMNANGQHSEKSEAIGIVYVGTPDITSRFNKAAGITLGWNRIEGATGYAIYRKTYSGTDAWVRIATIEGNSTFTWQDTSVKNNNGSAYKYTVRALAGADMKTLSGCRNAGRSMVRLTSRTLSSAVKASATSIKCTWTTSAVVTGYEVRFMVGSTVYKTFTVGNYKTGVKTFTGLESGKTYKIQVRSYVKIDGMGFYSAWSTARNVTLP